MTQKDNSFLKNAVEKLIGILKNPPSEDIALDCIFQYLDPHKSPLESERYADKFSRDGVLFYPIAEVDPEKPIYPQPKSPELLKNCKNLASALETEYAKAQTNDEYLVLLERFGGFVAALDDNGKRMGGVSYYDKARIDHSISQCGETALLVRADISGIQSFIENVKSDGALRNLRARSFYLELLAQHVIERLLDESDEESHLDRSHVMYVGGGGFQMLLPLDSPVEEIAKSINGFLSKKHLGTLKFIMAWVKLEDTSKLHSPEDLKEYNKNLSRQISIAKGRLKKDDLEIMFGGYTFTEEDTTDFGEVGRKLPKSFWVVYSQTKPVGKNYFEIEGAYYQPREVKPSKGFYFSLNSWHSGGVPMLTGRYAVTQGEIPSYARNSQELPEEESVWMADAEMLSKVALGQPRIAVYRCDADNMGKIFMGNIPEHNVYRHATLSRLMALFFQGYSNTIARKNHTHPANAPQNPYIQQDDKENMGRFLNFVYTGGDDVFVVGAWNDVFNFAIDLRQAYSNFTGNNQHLGLSGGSFIAKAKYPLQRMAQRAKEAEDLAKKAENVDQGTKKDGFVPFLEPNTPITPEQLAKRWETYFNFGDEKNFLNSDSTEKGLKILEKFLDLKKTPSESYAVELEMSRGFFWNLARFVNTQEDAWSVPLLYYGIARASMPADNKAWQDLKDVLTNRENWQYLGMVLSFLHLARASSNERGK